MGRVSPVFDTNILIDYLAGIPQAKAELDRFPASCISTITWIEVMAGARDEAEEDTLRQFLRRFRTIPVDNEVAEQSFRLRRQHRVKLPDAIIWATAHRQGTLLVTRNTKDFPEGEPGIRIPYQL
jgi:predicted nucleic acid-binding protein